MSIDVGAVRRTRAAFRIFCTGCGQDLAEGFHPFCPDCGAISDVEYDLAALTLRESSNPYLRYADLLPITDPTLFPDATFTPTVHARRLGAEVGLPRLYLKNETVLPTGTTKDRMAAVALAYLYERGVRTFATSSTGNSSRAYARAISRMPGMVMYLFTASAFRHRLALPVSDQIVDVVLEDASFVEAFAMAGRFAQLHGIASERGFFNIGRREGLKVTWLEAAEQVGRPIDWYVQAVSSAMGVYGVYKGARELKQAGLAERVPRLLCVQQESCAPMVTAWRDGAEGIRPVDIVSRPKGIAAAILRGDPTRTYPHIRRIVKESDGTFASVTEDEIREARHLTERLEGISPCFAAAAALAGLIKLRRTEAVPMDDTFLVNLTGSDRPGTPPDSSTHWLSRTASGWDLGKLPLVGAVGSRGGSGAFAQR